MTWSNLDTVGSNKCKYGKPNEFIVGFKKVINHLPGERVHWFDLLLVGGQSVSKISHVTL